MSTDSKRRAARPSGDAQFPRLEEVTLPAVPTSQAAHYLNRKDQTLRKWASRDEGPLRPLRVYGRLEWPTSELKRLLGLEDGR